MNKIKLSFSTALTFSLSLILFSSISYADNSCTKVMMESMRNDLQSYIGSLPKDKTRDLLISFDQLIQAEANKLKFDNIKNPPSYDNDGNAIEQRYCPIFKNALDLLKAKAQ